MISYLLIILLVIFSGIYVIFRLTTLDGIIRSTNSVDVQAIRLSREIAQAVTIQTGFEKKYLISGDRDFYDEFLKMNRYLDGKTVELEQIAVTPELKGLSASLRKAQMSYRSLFDRAVRKNPGSDYRRERDRIIGEIESLSRRIADASDRARTEKLQSSERISAQIVKAITATETGAVLLVVLISLLITRSINKPIRLLRDKTKLIARGDFSRPVRITSPPEIRELAESFNLMCERLQELDQMKIDFISHLSHELRTPLTAIKEASCMLMEGVYAQFPEKQQELFDIVNGECERLIRSVSRILDLSRMEAGMTAFHFEPSDIAPVVSRVAAKLSPIAERKRIRLELPGELSAGEMPVIRIDQDMIAQVIENLLANALKYTDEGGEVRISLSHNRERRTVQIAVSDTGCGIPGESLQEIFEKFKRVDDRKGAVRGTGLGLAISKHIINAHGGSIWAESEPGKGSTFIFSLPLSSASS